MRVLLAYFTDRPLGEIPYIPIETQMMIELVPGADSCEELELILSDARGAGAPEERAGVAREVTVEVVSRSTTAIARTCR
jgi:hypothetical protein